MGGKPLDDVYPFVFIDAVHFDNRVVKKATYIVLSINFEGDKNVLEIYIGQNESVKYWRRVMQPKH